MTAYDSAARCSMSTHDCHVTGQMLASRVLGPPAPNTFHISRAARHATALVEDLQARRRVYKQELAASKRAAGAAAEGIPISTSGPGQFLPMFAALLSYGAGVHGSACAELA